MVHKPTKYYLPSPSSWPLKGSIGLICTLAGAANWIHGASFGPYLFFFGLLMIIYIVYGWFGTVIRENRSGVLQNKQVDRSFRWGMCWFIFSEVMFFGCFFGALFYVRLFVLPVLGGQGSATASHYLLWPGFESTWPLLKNPNTGSFVGPIMLLCRL